MNRESLIHLVHSICTSTAAAVSDGSFYDSHKFGTSATVFDTGQHLIIIQNIVPGLPAEQSSYRSELAGIYTFLHFLLHLESHYGLQSGHISFGCDNKSALETSFGYAPDTCNQSDYDLVSAIHHLLAKLKVDISW